MKKAVLVFTVAVLFSSCIRNRNDEIADDKFEFAEETNTFVSTVQAKDEIPKEEKMAYIKINGSVIAENSVSVFPEVGGKLVNTFVRLGSSVRKGDAIAEINPSDAGSRYNNYIARSTISGVVTSIPLKEGSTVSTETVVAIVSDTSHLQILCDVPERHAAFLKKGLRAQVSLVAYPDETFAARVETFSPVIDEIKRTKQVFLEFNEVDARIEAGMFAKLKLFIEE